MSKSIKFTILILLVRLIGYAQAPVISSFLPVSAGIGASLTINGQNFNATPANNIVYFGPVQATVNTASTTQLTVTVPAGAAYGSFLSF